MGDPRALRMLLKAGKKVSRKKEKKISQLKREIDKKAAYERPNLLNQFGRRVRAKVHKKCPGGAQNISGGKSAKQVATLSILGERRRWGEKFRGGD